jgi:integrase
MRNEIVVREGKGGKDRIIQELLGHRDVKTTMIYYEQSVVMLSCAGVLLRAATFVGPNST